MWIRIWNFGAIRIQILEFENKMLKIVLNKTNLLKASFLNPTGKKIIAPELEPEPKLSF